MAHAAPLAPAAVRQVVRRLERKLIALGEPPPVEFCEGRGYRVRVSVALYLAAPER